MKNNLTAFIAKIRETGGILNWLDLKYRNLLMLPSKYGERRLVKNIWTGKNEYTRGTEPVLKPLTELQKTKTSNFSYSVEQNSIRIDIPMTADQISEAYKITRDGSCIYSTSTFSMKDINEYLDKVLTKMKEAELTMKKEALGFNGTNTPSESSIEDVRQQFLDFQSTKIAKNLYDRSITDNNKGMKPLTEGKQKSQVKLVKNTPPPPLPPAPIPKSKEKPKSMSAKKHKKNIKPTPKPKKKSNRKK